LCAILLTQHEGSKFLNITTQKQYKMNKKLLFIGGVLAFLLIIGTLLLNAQSKRYVVIEKSCVLDKWTGDVTYQGQKVYNVRKQEAY
jgi:hypothetical protein